MFGKKKSKESLLSATKDTLIGKSEPKATKQKVATPKAKSTKTTTKRKENDQSLQFVSSYNEALAIKSNRAILIGACVLVALKEPKIRGFSALPPRKPMSMLRSLRTRSNEQVHVAVDEEILSKTPKKIDFALAIDAYLQFGFTTKDDVAVIGGMADESNTNINIFVFSDGILTSTLEQNIPSALTKFSAYSEQMSTTISDLRMSKPDIKVYIAQPLVQFETTQSDVEFLGTEIYKSLKYASLAILSGAKSKNNLLPIAVVLGSLVCYGGLIAKGWSEFQSSIADYEIAMNDPVVKANGGVGGGFLDKVQQRRFFLEEKRAQPEIAARARIAIDAVAKIPDVRIIQISVQDPSRKPSTSDQDQFDLRVQISVPNSGQIGLDQGKEILNVLSAHTGMSLHMARQGMKEAEKRRLYTFEGNLNGK